MRYNRLLMCICLFSSLSAAQQDVNEVDNRRYVYKDYGDPANMGTCCSIMPARAAETNMIIKRPAEKPGFGGTGTNIQFIFDVEEPPRWAGAVFPVIEDYWGEWDASGVDLSMAKKLVFYAKGEIGGERIQVKAAIAGDKPYGDSALIPITTEWITLERAWKRYEVPVDGSQLKRVITLFSVVANSAYNPSGKLIFYLDEIYYDIADETE